MTEDHVGRQLKCSGKKTRFIVRKGCQSPFSVAQLHGLCSLSLDFLMFNLGATPAWWDYCEHQMKNNYKKALWAHAFKYKVLLC